MVMEAAPLEDEVAESLKYGIHFSLGVLGSMPAAGSLQRHSNSYWVACPPKSLG